MRARSLGKLVLKAQALATSVIGGAHGRRRSGSGDDFWQFRPYLAGLPVRRIDWRRSARGNTLYIRDHEWEIAQTVFLCPDLSTSMCYQSRFARHSKEVHTLILTLALAEIFGQAGECIAVPGLLEPSRRRDGAHHVARALSVASGEGKQINDFSRIRRAAHVIILSDFLEDFDLIEQRLHHLSERMSLVTLVEIADPAEEIFPYQGNIVFSDPENGQEINVPRAQDVADDYKKLYLARRATLRDLSRRHGWHFVTSLTDQSVSNTLKSLYLTMQARRS